MPDMTCKKTLPLLALLGAVASTPALAQQDRWFRVELLVFANETTQQPLGAAIAEQWEATPTLAYPLASRFLVDPTRVAENAAEFDGESVIDEYGRQIITIVTEGDTTGGATPGNTGFAGQQPNAAAAVADTPAPAPLPVPPQPVYQGGAPVGQAPAATPQAPVTAPALPRPFVLLPDEYLELRGKAALMQRSGSYTVLFHETWVQPVPPQERSLPIVLDHTGDTQEWSRLQGTINVFLSRYLHVETNLWLNTQGTYFPGTWQMPAPPLGPPSLIIEEQEPLDIAAAIEQLPVAGAAAEGAAATTEVNLALRSALADTGGSATAQDPNQPLMGLNGEEPGEVIAPVYPYRHAVLLDQTRRMRSNETHYIDHPLMGMVIKFTPITAEELNAIAAQQQVSAGEVQLP